MYAITYDGGMKRSSHTDSASEQLRSLGLRATAQRTALLQTLVSSKGPLSVEALTRAVGGACDLATAYRVLDAFVLVGLAKRIDVSQGRALYEAASEHHHHAVCLSCGVIKDIDACLPSGIDARVQKASGFAAITEHSLEFFGTCVACSKKQP